MMARIATPTTAAGHRWADLVRIREDPLVRNSFFLMATTGLTALLGFVFWLIVARLYPVDEVGQATSLLSALALLSYFSLVGMGSSLVRRLPTLRRRSVHVSSALGTVAVTSVLIAAVYAVVASNSSSSLEFLRGWSNVGIFAVLAMFAAINLLSNSVFVALRSAKYNLLINGVLMGTAKLVLPFLFVWAGPMGIYVASGLASGLAGAASLLVIHRRMGIRLRFTVSLGMIRETFAYSASTYLSGSLNLAPLLIIPIVLLDRLGPQTAAAYFIAFQIATVINSVSFAVGESLFAEGSHREESLRALMIRSATIMVVVTTPVVGAIVLLAGPVLSVFGDAYVESGRVPLVVLAVSAFPVAFHTWISFLLKISDRLWGMIVSEAVFAIVTTAAVVLVAPLGSGWVASAWGAGNAVAGAVALAAFAVGHRRRTTKVRPSANGLVVGSPE